jgi:hypothetical protein
MATTGKSQNKSAFLLDLLKRNPQTTFAQAEEAWKAAGNEGTVSSSSFYNAKTALGKPANGASSTAGKGRPAAKAAAKSPAKPTAIWRAAKPDEKADGPRAPVGRPKASSTRDQGLELDAVEGEIDELIFKLKGLGGVPDVEEALRRARRMLALKHGL